MSGDFTRDTFRPAKAYSLVRMQQGRLFTDADWNEQGDIHRHALRRTARSVIGASGFPEDNPGFAILPVQNGQALLIGGGEAYVDGARVVHDTPERLTLKRGSGAGAATRWQVEAGSRVKVGDYLVLAGSPINQAVRVASLHADVDGRQRFQCAAVLSPIDDITVDRYRSPESQPFLPPSPLPGAAGDYLFYLDVWERPVGVMEDPLLRETAFGGPDTAGRDQTIWQVKVVSLADLVAAGALALPAACTKFGSGWTPFGASPAGAMAARAHAVAAAADPCALPSTGGYRSLENHLYRVEIHRTATLGGGGTILVKWSRDNAIHRAAYTEIDSGALIVDSVGRDATTALKRDDWIEILDEDRTLAGQPGFFGRISDVNGQRVTLGELRHPDTLAPLTANNAPDLSGLPASGRVRRWEGGLPQTVASNGWLALENGIEVSFSNGRHAGGDHWLIPARSISADIEWPDDEATGAAARLPAVGIVHHYCALALGTLAAGAWALTDCRTLFSPLTALRSFLYLGGDGQEARPNPLAPATLIPLGAALRVGAIRGKTPLAGLSVEFTVTQGAGRLGAIADNLQTRKAVTGADGVATMAWAVDATNQTQQVTARLLDSAGQATHLPIVFTASLSRAIEVSFDPANTPALAGENTVQGAIEKLAGMQGTGCSTYVIVEGSNWVSVLEGLKPNEDAAICFQRGTYQTDRPVKVSGCGHITLSGAGNGTRIVANRAECALLFDKCKSVTLHDLSIAAPDGSGTIEHIAERHGVVTILSCPEVDVIGVSLRCGGGATTERTCLTARGTGETPLESVRVLRNRLDVGLAQDGILVTDCLNTLIADNELWVIPGKAGLTPQRLFEDAVWRRRLVDLLVADPRPSAAKTPGNTRRVRAGSFVATFESAVPQDQWDKLALANPPTANDLGNATTVKAYVARLVDGTIAQPDRLPAYSRSIGALRTRIGDTRMATIDNEIKRSLIMATDTVVQPVAQPPTGGGDGRVLLTAGTATIAFASPVGQADWNAALRLVPFEGAASEPALIRHVQKVANRLVAEAAFRDRLASAKNWFDGFVAAVPSYARQAIVCGGRTLLDVAVTNNRVDGFNQGTHIAPSVQGEKVVQARTVHVQDNVMMLRMPGEGVYSPMGLFVGNAETIRIQNNTLDWSGQRPKSSYAHGIRVWGHIGRYLVVSENRVAIAKIGIRAKLLPKSREDDYHTNALWIASENLVQGVDAAHVVVAPEFMIRRDNRPH
jgi:hypothetical protein